MKLIDQYPYLLKLEPTFQLIQQALENETIIERGEWEELFSQFFIDTATWSLSEWEKFAGLEVAEDLDIETRRSNVLARLRSRDITTVEKIRVVSESYSNGECEVIEENEKYIFHVKFIGTRGIPKNLAELRKSIDRIKPAHLRYDFIFTYLTWDDFDNYNYTWQQWDDLNLTWDELEVYK